MTFHSSCIHLAGTVTVGPKGQVVIPVEVREKMGVKPGDKLIALFQDNHKTVSFVTETEMQTMINKMGSHLTTMSEELTNANQTEGTND